MKLATDVPRNQLACQFCSAMFFELVGNLEFGRVRPVTVPARKLTHKEA